jgi:hypothetical protein
MCASYNYLIYLLFQINCYSISNSYKSKKHLFVWEYPIGNVKLGISGKQKNSKLNCIFVKQGFLSPMDLKRQLGQTSLVLVSIDSDSLCDGESTTSFAGRVSRVY